MKVMMKCQDETLKDTCRYWKSYKGQREPRCNGGDGCKACWLIYEQENCNHPIDELGHGDALTVTPQGVVSKRYIHHLSGSHYRCRRCFKVFETPTNLDLLKKIQQLEWLADEHTQDIMKIDCKIDDISCKMSYNS